MKNSTTKSYARLIPNIQENIEKILKQLNLEPEEWPKDFIERTKGIKHRYSSVGMYKGKKVMFYAGLHKDDYEKDRMRTETEIAKVLKNNPVFPYFPRYLEAETSNNLDWLIREWFPSLPIEHKQNIEKLKKELTNEEIKEIAKATYDMNMLDTSLFPFLNKIEKHSEAKEMGDKLDILNDKERQELDTLINIDLEKEHKYFNHGDFQIGNILVFDKIKIIDLESAVLNNFAWDIAFLTTRMWQDSKTRTQLINEFYNLVKEKGSFTSLFRLNSFIIANQSYYSEPTEYTKEQLETRKQYYARFIKACLKDFDSLVNLE